MKTTAIIAEYNPFHNGHKFHIEKARELTNADYVIAIMSSSFVQRGDCAVFDKWCRTRAALSCGADMVIELPVVYSTSSAEGFASGAVKIAEESSIADCLAFGVETDDITALKATADILCRQPEEYRNSLKTHLSDGLSFPAARALSLVENGISGCILSQPNNILAVEYMKALQLFSSTIEPVIVHRTTSEFNSEEISGNIASATAVRKALYTKQIALVKSTVPENCFRLYQGCNSVFADDFSSYLNYALRYYSAEELKQISSISEGLENRILKTVGEYDKISDICTALKTKRYTYTRLMRTLFHIILGITKEHENMFSPVDFEPYIRVLGFRQSALSLVKSLTQNASVPVIMNINKDEKKLSDSQKKLLEFEKKATNIYFAPNNGKLGLDYTMPLIVEKDI